MGLYKEGKVLNRGQTKTWRAKTVALIEAHQMHNHGRLHGIFGDREQVAIGPQVTPPPQHIAGGPRP